MRRNPNEMDVRLLARARTASCIRSLGIIVAKSKSDSARVAAAGILLDRGWGKAPQSHTGADGEGEIRVIIRHIINGRDVDQAMTIDHSSALQTEGQSLQVIDNADDGKDNG